MKSVQMRSFFWPVFSCIRTEYADILRKSPYSVRIQENTDQKKLRIWTLFTQCEARNFNQRILKVYLKYTSHTVFSVRVTVVRHR